MSQESNTPYTPSEHDSIISDPSVSQISRSSEEPEQNLIQSFLDREERAVAALLTRFKNLVELATATPSEGATKEVAATHAYQMEVESNALVQAAEDLLKLSRELKEMWLFGPLRGIGEGEGEGSIDLDSKKVGEMVESVLDQAALAKANAEMKANAETKTNAESKEEFKDGN